MSNRLYTNTSNVGAMIGLFVTTVALSYATQHATEIVDSTVKAVKDGVSAVKNASEKAVRGNKQKYHVLARDYDGQVYDTGKVVWK